MISKLHPSDEAIDVLIVTYQSERWLGACLESIPSRVDELPVRVLVVDSASDDGTLAVAATHPHVDLLALTENRGFAYAINRGMAATAGRYCLFLNPDAALGVDTLTRLVRRVRSQPDLAGVVPEVVDGLGRAQVVAQARPTLRGEIARRAERIARPLGWRRPDELREGQRPDWVTGACFMTTREAWRTVGPFDAGYFLYFAETDWCLRAAGQGLKVEVVEGALAVHVGGASSTGDRQRSLARSYFRRSRRRFFQRHDGHLTAFLVDALHGLMDGLESLRRRGAQS
ncbi:MAG: glycosyltransferase family 2 protein [Planctomycetota bacterium]